VLQYGLPTSQVTDMGNHYAIRLQRAVIQEWKQDVPWAKAGQATVANGGDIGKEAGLWPAAALPPSDAGAAPVAPAAPAAAAPAARPPPAAPAAPAAAPAAPASAPAGPATAPATAAAAPAGGQPSGQVAPAGGVVLANNAIPPYDTPIAW